MTLNYQPEGKIKTHQEKIEWDEEDEIVYRKLKYDLKKPSTPLKKEFNTSGEKFKDWLKKLPECCTIMILPRDKGSLRSLHFVVDWLRRFFNRFIFYLLLHFSKFGTLILYTHVDRELLRNSGNCPVSEVSTYTFYF